MIEPLLRWYDQNARDLPWRQQPDPYRVWVSEVMLQQTRVEAVLPYYRRFVTELPDVAALADCPAERLMKLWEGLGYYSRVRNLQQAACRVVSDHGGQFPRDYAAVRALPGVGDYTAGAVCSICFGLPTPAVDGNVLRVVARLTGDDSDILALATRRRIREQLLQIYPQTKRCGDLTQALMELGATVCTPQSPRCTGCPLAHWCVAHQNGWQAVLPVRAAPKPRPTEQHTVLLLCCGDRVAIERRPARGLLAGQWQLPNLDGCLSAAEVADWLAMQGIAATTVIPGGCHTHIFTHRRWELHSYRVDCSAMGNKDDYRWVTLPQLHDEVALPTAFRYFIDLV